MNDREQIIKRLSAILNAAGFNIQDEPRVPLAEWSADGPLLRPTKLGMAVYDCAESKQSELDNATARIAQLEAFVQTCVDAAGYEINGNMMSNDATKLLAESHDTWLSQHDKAVEVKVLEYVFVNAVRDGCNKYTGDDVVETIKYMIESRK